jgi:hypothetical protein
MLVLELGDLLRLALEAFPQAWIAAPLSGQHFDGDVSLEAGVPGFVDLAHAALAEQRDDLVGTKASPIFEGQVLASYRAVGALRKSLGGSMRRCASPVEGLDDEATSLREVGVSGSIA